MFSIETVGNFLLAIYMIFLPVLGYLACQPIGKTLARGIIWLRFDAYTRAKLMNFKGVDKRVLQFRKKDTSKIAGLLILLVFFGIYTSPYDRDLLIYTSVIMLLVIAFIAIVTDSTYRTFIKQVK